MTHLDVLIELKKRYSGWWLTDYQIFNRGIHSGLCCALGKLLGDLGLSGQYSSFEWRLIEARDQLHPDKRFGVLWFPAGRRKHRLRIIKQAIKNERKRTQL